MNKRSDEWYTPRHIVEALGRFDLDPCAAPDPSLHFATANYTAADNGLARPWIGRVFLNPPYSHPLIDRFVKKMVAHPGGGILLTFNRLDSSLFQDVILPGAKAVLFLRGRIRFSNAAAGANCGSMLTAFTDADARVLAGCGLPGFFIALPATRTTT